MFICLELHKIILTVSNFLLITSSQGLLNPLLTNCWVTCEKMFYNWFLQTCMFFKKIHYMCKHCLLVVFHILLRMFTICFSNARIFLFIFAFVHHQATHSFVLSIVLFHFVPHVLIYNKCWKMSNWVSSFGYSQGFVVISHILSNMRKIIVYAIIDSNVFGVKINGNFPLAIVK